MKLQRVEFNFLINFRSSHAEIRINACIIVYTFALCPIHDVL